MNETVICWSSRLLTYGNTSYLFFPCQHMGDNPPKTNVATTPRTGRNKTPWTLTKLAPRQPPPSHNIITIISSLPYITTSTPLSPLSANDSLPSPPLDPSNLNPFFDFSHLRQLLISRAASPRPLPLLRGRPTPPKQCNIDIRTPRGWETTPSDTSPASFRNFCPRPRHRGPHRSKHHRPRPPAQGRARPDPARGYSRCPDHPHGQQAQHVVPRRHVHPSPASPTLPLHRRGSSHSTKSSQTDDFRAARSERTTHPPSPNPNPDELLTRIPCGAPS